MRRKKKTHGNTETLIRIGKYDKYNGDLEIICIKKFFIQRLYRDSVGSTEHRPLLGTLSKNDKGFIKRNNRFNMYGI